MNPNRPTAEEHLPYFSRYIDLVPEGDINTLLETQFEPLYENLKNLSLEQTQFRYAPSKWNVLEVLGHLSDTERVFTFRALHIARGDPSPLPGFDQDTWLQKVDFASRDLSSLLLEWHGVRTATISLFSSLDSAAWLRRGVASGHAMTPRACAYIIVGHAMYHQQLLREKYGLVV
jgi:hypothetical protein